MIFIGQMEALTIQKIVSRNYIALRNVVKIHRNAIEITKNGRFEKFDRILMEVFSKII